MGLSLDPNFQKYSDVKLSGLSKSSIAAVLSLASEGGTIPFISRYRKEATGNLDEVQVRTIVEAFEDWKELDKRKTFILSEIEKKGGLTPEFKLQIQTSLEMFELEELYRPFKRQKKTKAQLAKEAGIEPLAHWIWSQGQGEAPEGSTTLEVKAKEYIKPSAGYPTYEEVLRGAQHIIVEKLVSFSNLRQAIKDEAFQRGTVSSKPTSKFKTHSKYEMYADFSDSVQNLLSKKASHRYLALRRGWQEGELKVSLEFPEEELVKQFEAVAVKRKESHVSSLLKQAAQTALKVHLIPSVVNEQHSLLKESADKFAIEVFSQNVRKILMFSPFGARVVLGVDPGLKTGCKLALVDERGQFISSTVLYTLGEGAKVKAKNLFEEVLKQIQIEAIAVGHGTGGREAETFIRDALKEIGKEEVPVVMVNEAGASVYSASDVAREEFPDLDLTVRGAISIARRLQDPLAEFVKVPPKSIGVGQYQHDVSQGRLKKSLYGAVESCVNEVGVDLNTASSSLLQYVAGIGPALAKAIVSHRKEKGLFKERGELMKVARFSSKVFEQSVGFLRIRGGGVPLDGTGIHPERYMVVGDMAREVGVSVAQLLRGSGLETLRLQGDKWSHLVGEYTLGDIMVELEKPGHDPRDPYKVFKFREDIHEIKDLKKDMLCPGVVTNVTNFGAFVDIGVHQDGLVHISELSHVFVSDPQQVVGPGEQVQVKVLAVDKAKNQISLTMCLKDKVLSSMNQSRSSDSLKVGSSRPSLPSHPNRQQKVEDRQQNLGAKPKLKSLFKQDKIKKIKGKGSSKTFQHRAKSEGGGHRKASSGKTSSGKARLGRRTSQPFNNPFAALTELKK